MCKGCKDCWHNYHCPMPQEGYDYNPDTCEYNPDNEMRENDRKKFPHLVSVLEEMKTYERNIFKFDHAENNFIPYSNKVKPKENGLYLTIRCGLSGIYTVLNEWKDDNWQMAIADGSTTVAFDPTPVVLNSMETKNIKEENEE